MKVRLLRAVLAIAVGTATVFLLYAIGFEALHRYRVWRADGKWCALGSNEVGWQFGYGEESCPEL